MTHLWLTSLIIDVNVTQKMKLVFNLLVILPFVLYEIKKVVENGLTCVPYIVLQCVNVTLCVPCIISQSANDQRDAQFLYNFIPQFFLLYMFRKNLVVHHQEHSIIYCITQFGTIGTIVQASLAASS